MAILLLAYHYNVQYHSTSQHSNADMLSRLPLATPVSSEPTFFNIKQIDSLPVTTTELQEATCHPVLGRVFRYISQIGLPILIIILSLFIVIKMNLLVRIFVSYRELVLSFLLSCKNVS